MYLESLVTNSISVEQELRGARACDTLLQSYFCSTGVDERLCTFTQTIKTEVLDSAVSGEFQIWSLGSRSVQDGVFHCSRDCEFPRFHGS